MLISAIAVLLLHVVCHPEVRGICWANAPVREDSNYGSGFLPFFINDEGIHKIWERLHETREDLHEAQDELHETREGLHETQDELHETREDLHETQDKLHETREDLHETQNELHET